MITYFDFLWKLKSWIPCRASLARNDTCYISWAVQKRSEARRAKTGARGVYLIRWALRFAAQRSIWAFV